MLFAVAMTAFLPQVTFGCVYEFETMTTFTCLHGDYIIRLESRYNATLQDRKWCYECTTGGGYVNYDCFWHVQYPGQPTFGVECPFGSLITGMYSDYSPKDKYRIYTAECCKVSLLRDTFNPNFTRKVSDPSKKLVLKLGTAINLKLLKSDKGFIVHSKEDTQGFQTDF